MKAAEAIRRGAFSYVVRKGGGGGGSDSTLMTAVNAAIRFRDAYVDLEKVTDQILCKNYDAAAILNVIPQLISAWLKYTNALRRRH
jgi:hypothetical protein